MSVRLGLIGLVRIGAFHARTLAELPQVDSLVVADLLPALTKDVAVVSTTRYDPRGYDVRLELSWREHRPVMVDEVKESVGG